MDLCKLIGMWWTRDTHFVYIDHVLLKTTTHEIVVNCFRYLSKKAAPANKHLWGFMGRGLGLNEPGLGEGGGC